MGGRGRWQKEGGRRNPCWLSSVVHHFHCYMSSIRFGPVAYQSLLPSQVLRRIIILNFGSDESFAGDLRESVCIVRAQVRQKSF
jgi:hypothetical protein